MIKNICPPGLQKEWKDNRELDRSKPLLVYDGDCAFCRLWIDYWRRLTKDRMGYAPFQRVAKNFPEIPLESFQRAVQLILPDGKVFSGAAAVFHTLSFAPSRQWLWRLYQRLPAFASIAEFFYRFIADRRFAFYPVTLFLYGSSIQPATYFFSSWLFFKILGVVYLIAFVSFGLQIEGLIGSQGILPLNNYLQALRNHFGSKAFWFVPSIFWFNSSDWFLKFVWVLGAVASLLLIFGIAPRGALVLAVVLYLSLVSAGQVFMSFQWDILLVEVEFLGLVYSLSPGIGIWLFWLLLFKLIFLSGAVKLLSGDPTWRNLTALTYHYATQPLPTALAWYADKLPLWFQKFSVLAMFAIQLTAPFFIFTLRHLRFAAGFGIAFLELLIFLTGNYTFFNILTIALCLFLFDDQFWSNFISSNFIEKIAAQSFVAKGIEGPFQWIVLAIALLIALISIFHIVGAFTHRLPTPARFLMQKTAAFHIANPYGLFAVMTTSRPEIVIEGSNDQKTWFAYGFKYKPGDLKRAPLWVQPHQPRLDWQMWFAALGTYQENPWFVNFAIRLLEGSPPVQKLLKTNPFLDAPPKYIRAVLYDYRFSDSKTKAKTGEWWTREFRGLYLPPVTLEPSK